MNKRMLPLSLASILIISSTVSVSAESASAQSSADDECKIDEILKENRVAMDAMAAGVFEQSVSKPVGSAIESAPKVKDASCLPMLDALDSMMRLRIPSTGMAAGALLTRLRDMACNMANTYLERMANGMNFNISDPLGVASVGVGATTDGSSGVQTETYDFGEVVGGAIMQEVKKEASQVGNSAAQSAINSLPGSVDRTPRIESTVRDEVRGVINGL